MALEGTHRDPRFRYQDFLRQRLRSRLPGPAAPAPPLNPATPPRPAPPPMAPPRPPAAAAAPPVAPPPVAAPAPAPVPDRRAELLSRVSKTDQLPVQKSTGPSDNTSTYRMLDAIFSGLAGQPYDSNYWLRLQDRKAGIGDYAPRSSGLTPEQLEMQRKRLAQGKRRLDIQEKQGGQRIKIAGRRQSTREEEQDAKLNPDHPMAQRMQEFYIQNGVDPRDVEGRSVNELVDHHPELAKKFDNANRAMLAQTEGEVARGKVASTMDLDVEEARRKKAAIFPMEMAIAQAGPQARLAGERAAYGAPLPGLDVFDQAAYEQAMADPVQRGKIYAMSSANRGMGSGLERMIDLRQQHGIELPGEVQADFDLNKTLVIGSLTQLAASGVLNQGEWERYSKAIPGLSVSWGDLQGLMQGEDIPLSQLRGVKRALDAMMGAKSFPYGFRMGGAAPVAEGGFDVPAKVPVTGTAGPKVNKVVGARAPDEPGETTEEPEPPRERARERGAAPKPAAKALPAGYSADEWEEL